MSELGGRRQEAGGRRQKAEGRRQKAEVRSQKSEVRSQLEDVPWNVRTGVILNPIDKSHYKMSLSPPELTSDPAEVSSAKERARKGI